MKLIGWAEVPWGEGRCAGEGKGEGDERALDLSHRLIMSIDGDDGGGCANGFWIF